MIGLNILGDRGFDQNALVAFLRAALPRYTLVMNNPSLAARISASVATHVIYREWTNDDDAHLRADPVTFVRQRHDLAPPGALLYLCNEPTNDWQRLRDWTLTALATCEQLGRRGVVFNFSTGRPEPDDWRIFVPVIERCFMGKHLIGLHEYFDRSIATSERWHVGRFQVLKSLAGERCPEIVITELACAVGLDPHKGWREALSQSAYANELIQAGQLYNDAGIGGACVFSWGSWQSFDVSDAGELQQRMIAQNQRWNVAEEVTWVNGTVRPGGNWSVNVRAQPNTISAVLATLQGEVAAKYATGDTWTRVQVLGVEGYIRNDVAIFGEPVVVPPDTPVPDGGQTEYGNANAIADMEQATMLIQRATTYWTQKIS